MLYGIELGFLISHFAAYREQITNVFINFAITFALKRLLKSINDTEKSDMVSLAGYSLTFASFLEYLAAVKEAGTGSTITGVTEPVKGLIPELIDAIKETISSKN